MHGRCRSSDICGCRIRERHALVEARLRMNVVKDVARLELVIEVWFLRLRLTDGMEMMLSILRNTSQHMSVEQSIAVANRLERVGEWRGFIDGLLMKLRERRISIIAALECLKVSRKGVFNFGILKFVFIFKIVLVDVE